MTSPINYRSLSSAFGPAFYVDTRNPKIEPGILALLHNQTALSLNSRAVKRNSIIMPLARHMSYATPGEATKHFLAIPRYEKLPEWFPHNIHEFIHLKDEDIVAFVTFYGVVVYKPYERPGGIRNAPTLEQLDSEPKTLEKLAPETEVVAQNRQVFLEALAQYLGIPYGFDLFT